MKNMLFMKYFGMKYPEGHSKAGSYLPDGVTLFAIPGGGVATEEACRLWGLRNSFGVRFNVDPWSTK